MTYGYQAAESAIAGDLLRHAPEAHQTGRGSWSVALSNGRPHLVTARLDGDWLVLDTELAPGPVALLDCLEWNAALGGAAKFAVVGSSLRLRAEIPLDDDAVLGGWLGDTLAGFNSALARMHGEPACDGPAEPENAAGMDLAALCGEAGWRFSERSGGALAVDLGEAGEHALAVPQPGGGLAVQTELLCREAAEPAASQALALFLLSACGLVRMARAAARREQQICAFLFEVRFSRPPSAAGFAHALSALSVARRLCAREACALEREEIARDYLAIRGWPSRPA
jgi:hypothetical protein